MPKKINAYMWGWHGQSNMGDDAFSVVVSWILREYAEAEKIFIQCDNSNILNKKYGIKIINKNLPGLTRIYNSYVKNKVDYFVLSGGSLLSSPTEVDALFRESQKRLTRNRRLFSLGISVGPFSSTEHEKTVKKYLENMSFVGFRDDFSYDWACSQEIDVPFRKAFDLAILLPQAIGYFNSQRNHSVNHSSKNNKTLGISLLAFHSQKDPNNFHLDVELAQKLASATFNIVNDYGFKIKLYALSNNIWSNDRKICEEFLHAYPNHHDISLYTHNGDAWETFQSIEQCSHFLSMRLHGSVFAYMNQIPNMILSYHPKCKSFASTLGHSSDLVLDIEEFDLDLYINSLKKLMRMTELKTDMSLSSAILRSKINLDFRHYLN